MVGSRFLRLFAYGLIPTAGMLFSGCSGDQNPLVAAGELQAKPADSVYRENSPQPRSGQLEDRLDLYRQQTYVNNPVDAPLPQGAFPPSVAPGRVPHDDVPFTAAYRHAVYLNGLNSVNWTRTNIAAPDAQIIKVGSEYAELLVEGAVAPINGEYPALATDVNLYQRVEAVRGGRDKIAAGSCRSTSIFESYVFNGNVEKPDGTVSFFRGFENTRGNFDAVQNVWYARRGRMLLARPSLRYFGYGQKCDDPRIDCGRVPYPILSGQFLGVLVMMHSYPIVQKFGWWPNNGNTDVIPYGLDTDIGGPEQFSGPPIHITLPINQPIPRTTGVRELTMTRVDAAGTPTAPTTDPSSRSAWQQFKVFSNVKGLIIPTIPAPLNGQFRAAGPIAALLSNIAVPSDPTNLGYITPPVPTRGTYVFTVDATTDLSVVVAGDILVINIKAGPYKGIYKYTIIAVNNSTKTVTILIPSNTFTTFDPLSPAFPPSAYLNNLDNLKLDFESTTSVLVSSLLDVNLQDGELVLVPIAPIQNLTSYRMTFRMVTPAFDSGVQTFTFTTNDTGIYP